MLLDGQPMLKRLYVKGEISNFKAYPSGHWYFTVKDDSSLIKAVMFRSNAQKHRFVPENGMKVLIRGSVSVFTRDGQYQLYADDISPDGVGALYAAFEQLREKLLREGLFDEAKKKPLPRFPSRIGIVTSPTGAAVRDMINVTGRRCPSAELVIYPSAVQGAEAVPQLISGVKYFSSTRSVDVIIIGRGGGSLEDLWAFNDEGLARVIAASEIPVISAVGHETDFTICDFAADRRAPTPSAAAELAVPDSEVLRAAIVGKESIMSKVVMNLITSGRETVADLSESRVMTDPQFITDRRRLLSDRAGEKLCASAKLRYSSARADIREYAAKLTSLNPLSVLARGYGAVSDADGNVVTRASELLKDEKISVRFSDGEASATVTDTLIYGNKA